MLSKHKRFFPPVFPVFFYLLLLIISIISVFLGFPYRDIFEKPSSTVLLDRKGELLGAKIASDGQWRFPAQDEVPLKFKEAILLFEDKRFYYHPGIDLPAIGRALYTNMKARKKVSGGSTITMQVIRLSRDGKPRSVKEKIIESLLALRLEVQYSKAEILAMYASHAPFGGNVVGLEAAAWRYFGRSADELSWAEAATLAVLPNAPALIHPGRNRKALLTKRNKLLHNMMKKTIIGSDDYELALLEPLPDRPSPLPYDSFHLLERLHRQNPGRFIHTSVDGRLQSNANRILHSYMKKYRANQVNHAAALVIDNKSGEVLAYIGNYFDPEITVDGSMVDIIPAARSGGSILKPFLFMGMLHDGLINESSLIADYPFQTPGFNPQNFDRRFDGAVPAHRALQRSLNVPAVRMLQSYGVERFHFLLQRLGMRTLNMPPQHYGLSLILGGAESSLWDVCAMYAGQSRVLSEYTLYNSMYRRGDIFRPLLLMNDNHSLPRKGTKQSSDEFEPTGLLDASAIWITYRALLEVNRPEEEAGWKMFANTRRIAWKTGTSYGNRDAWAIGTTPEYTVGVWVGNASGEGRPGLTGVAFAAPIMFDIFNLLPRTSAFEQPYDDMTQVAICRQSGHVAGRFCSETDTAWISLKGLRSMACPWHVPLQLDKSGQYRVNSNCYSVHEMQIQSWFVLPPAMEWFYKTRNASYASLPPWLPGCSDPYSSRPMELIYPSGDVNVMVPRELGGEAGRIVLQAVHQNPDALIFWHLNGEYIGSTRQEHYLAIHPSVGFQHLILTDENGFSLRQGFRVVANEKRVER